MEQRYRLLNRVAAGRHRLLMKLNVKIKFVFPLSHRPVGPSVLAAIAKSVEDFKKRP